MDIFSLKNKVAVVTGAGSGIGREVALLFARQQAIVYAVDLNSDALINVVHEIHDFGGMASPIVCDVTNQYGIVAAFRSLERIDILINSAGVAHIGNVETTSEEDFDLLYKVNIKGVYNCLFAAIPGMKHQGSGAIVNLASIANHVGLEDRFAYSMTKGAVAAMTLSVAKDYVHYGIRCNSVSPARVHTPFVDKFLQKNFAGREEEMFQKLSMFQPLGRMAKASEISFLILYICSEEASFITGCDYPIDGGVVHLR